MSRQGLSWKAKLKYAIDQVIKESEDFDDFLRKCAENGIMVEYNPDHKIDLKFILAAQKERNPRAKFTRAKTLGWFYETEQIKRRIAQYKRIAELRATQAQKNAQYSAAKQKADELSRAAAEIENYLRQEQSREQQKKRRRNDLE